MKAEEKEIAKFIPRRENGTDYFFSLNKGKKIVRP